MFPGVSCRFIVAGRVKLTVPGSKIMSRIIARRRLLNADILGMREEPVRSSPVATVGDLATIAVPAERHRSSSPVDTGRSSSRVERGRLPKPPGGSEHRGSVEVP
jgi:hypothetical protein